MVGYFTGAAKTPKNAKEVHRTMSACFVYITAPDKAAARDIGRALVDARLAACANIFDGMTSVYRWQGKIQEDSEAVLIAKTRADLVPALTEKVRALHRYDCPCIVALPVDGGSRAFLDWIDAETGGGC
jgi:periplasmic divalent cation tolerance protein